MGTNTDSPAIVAFINLKGGVGKTALSVNFAAYCGREGLKTLLIDLDPQTNATLSCMSVEAWKNHAAAKGSVADVLGARNHTKAEGNKKGIKDFVAKDVFKNVDLLPSHLDLFTVDLDIGGKTARESLLRKSLRQVKNNYDIIVCDCPPNLTIPTQNAIAVCTHFVVPVSPDFLSSLGVGLLLSRVEELADDLENPITNAGIVVSRVGRPSIFREQTIETLKAEFKDLVLDSIINERSQVSQSAAKNVSIFDMSDKAAKKEFSTFCAELLAKLGF